MSGDALKEKSFEQAFLPAIVQKERDFANSSKKKLADRASAARKKKKSLASSSSFPRLASSDLAHEEMAIQRELQRAIGILR